MHTLFAPGEYLKPVYDSDWGWVMSDSGQYTVVSLTVLLEDAICLSADICAFLACSLTRVNRLDLSVLFRPSRSSRPYNSTKCVNYFTATNAFAVDNRLQTQTQTHG